MKQKKELDAAAKKRRAFLLALPLLVLPFATLAFYALGGGKGNGGEIVVKETGLQTTLPESQATEAAEDKMSFYARADRDSMQLAEMKRLDPYYQNGLDTLHAQGLVEENYADAHEVRVMQRLHALQQAVNAPTPTRRDNNPFQPIREMQNFERSITHEKTSQEDPEVRQLNEMLDKIQAIQNPETAREKLRAVSEKQKGIVYAVSMQRGDDAAYFGRDTTRKNLAGFYAENDAAASESDLHLAIPALIHEAQSLTEGSTVKMRLASDVFIRGRLIPKNSFAFGVASIRSDRLEIKVANIQYKNDLFPVSLSVYDSDGIEGIYIPGSINREVSKNSTDQSLQGFNLISMDPSFKAQAAAAGVSAAKGLLSKKVKQVKVYVKANYRILLRDNNQQNF
jgi:conjugative transposon TraM protein